MESCQSIRGLQRGRIVEIEEVSSESEVYDIEVEDTHNYVANGILTSNSAAKSYRKVNLWLENAFYRYGLTGTYVRPDGRDMAMYGVLSNVIYRKSASDLIEEGWLVPADIKMIRYRFKGISKVNYKKAYEITISDNVVNSTIAQIAEEKIVEGKQTLVLVRRKDHGELLNRMIEDSVYISGDDSAKDREVVKRNFEAKKIRCIIATSVMNEGQDLSSIDVLINARFQQTEIQTLQGIGRTLRTTAGKNRLSPDYVGKQKAEVYDWLIEGQNSLKSHSMSRIESYKKERAFNLSIVKDL